MKRSRSRLTSATVPATNISGKGSRATSFTLGQGQKTIEPPPPPLLSLTCQPPVTRSSQRNISASSSWLKTGSVCLQSRVSTSIRPCSFLAISQYARPCARPAVRRVTVSSCSFLYWSLTAFEVPHDVIRYGRIPCLDPLRRRPSRAYSDRLARSQPKYASLPGPVSAARLSCRPSPTSLASSLALPRRLPRNSPVCHLPESSHVRRNPSMDMAPPSTVCGS